ncbi:ZIP zinc transporter [Candidatus Wolfebacteria bacterium]|nr:MAG: ZIP zinc transporter [Candidatus Wolfebacteria bacterium]
MLGYILIAVALEILVAFAGVFLVYKNVKDSHESIYQLISFSIGTFLGVVFFDLLPESIELLSPSVAMLYVLAGFLFFFLLTRYLYLHHHHHHEDDKCDHPHVDASGIMVLLADVLHNFIDGIIIAVAFIVDVNLGIVTTIAVLLHEFPQETSDFFVLIHSGFSRNRALLYNFLVSLSTLVGALLAYFLVAPLQSLIGPVLAISAGTLLYVAAADLMPQIQAHYKKGGYEILFLLLGVGVMYVLSNFLIPIL